MKRFAVAVVGACLVAGCSPEVPVDDGSEFATPSPTATVTLAPPSPTPTTFPAGYPKVVPVGSLPARLRDKYRADGATEAVQLAPGVWSPVQESAAIVTTRVLDGYCASVEKSSGSTAPG
jgi:hypothetical protein